MSDKYLNYEGLSSYNRLIRKYIQHRTPEAAEFKKGLMQISDLPCYTSDMAVKFSGEFTTGEHDSGDLQLSLDFLKFDAEGIDRSTGDIPEGTVFPLYTFVLDGQVFEHNPLYADTGYSFGNMFSMQIMPDDVDVVIEVEYATGVSSKIDVAWPAAGGREPEGTAHQIEIYQEGVETVHKLDSKYLPEGAVSEVIPEEDINELFGITTEPEPEP